MRAIAELENFTESEISSLSDEIKVKLQAIRYHADVPIHITSGLRVGDDGAHGLAQAVDISDNNQGEPISSRWRFLVVRAAIMAGINRIGVYDRHIHIDVSRSLDQDVCWLGLSS